MKHLAAKLVGLMLAIAIPGSDAFVVKPVAPAMVRTRLGAGAVAETKQQAALTAPPKGETFPELLQDFETYWKELAHECPGYTKQFWTLRSAVRKEDGPLDTKTKELIAIAISVAGTCDTCIAHHVYDALEAGATRAEIADALGVVALMSGGVGVAYATHAMRAVDQFEAMLKMKQYED